MTMKFYIVLIIVIFPSFCFSQETELTPEQCRKDVVCWGLENIVDAIVNCNPEIEKQAKYSFKWTDSWLEQEYSRYSWGETKDVINYYGDTLKFQNGFGAWQNVIYVCQFDTVKKIVLKVGVEAGRLP